MSELQIFGINRSVYCVLTIILLFRYLDEQFVMDHSSHTVPTVTSNFSSLVRIVNDLYGFTVKKSCYLREKC